MVRFRLRGRGWLPMRIPLGRRVVPNEVAVPEFSGSASSSPARARAGGLGGRSGLSACELDRFLGLGEVLRPILACSATMTACHCVVSPTRSETAEVGIAEVSDVRCNRGLQRR